MADQQGTPVEPQEYRCGRDGCDGIVKLPTEAVTAAPKCPKCGFSWFKSEVPVRLIKENGKVRITAG